MARRHHRAEDVINKLREAEVGLASGLTVPEVCRKLGVTEQTYYGARLPTFFTRTAQDRGRSGVADRGRDQRRDRPDQKRRSAGCSFGRRDWRVSTASC
jgi:hypothetical protein